MLNQKKIQNSFESPTGTFQAFGALRKTLSICHRRWYFVYSIYKTTSRVLVGPGHSLLTPGIPHLSFSNFVNALNAVIRAVTLQIDPGSEYMKAKRHRSFGIGAKAPHKTFGWRNKEELSVRLLIINEASDQIYNRLELLWKKSVHKSSLKCPMNPKRLLRV